jgi:hypothetical protein
MPAVAATQTTTRQTYPMLKLLPLVLLLSRCDHGVSFEPCLPRRAVPSGDSARSRPPWCSEHCAAMNPTTIITPAEAGPSSPSLGSGSRPASPAMTASQTLRKPASSGRLAKLLHPGRSRSGSSASQEATTITAYADDSGGNSGRSTPEQRRRTGKGQWPGCVTRRIEIQNLTSLSRCCVSPR